MSPSAGLKAVDLFVKNSTAIYAIADTANSNKKLLKGKNFYAQKFHRSSIELNKSIGKFKSAIRHLTLNEETIDLLIESANVISDCDTAIADKNQALKNIEFTCLSVVIPMIESSTATPEPETEQVLPMSVVSGTRGYIENIVRQANGCYEHQWFDACSVMIRRLTETLIIEVYESRGWSDDIKTAPGTSGDFFMLSKLVEIIAADKRLNLGREAKRGLPLLKSLGDRAAHNRHYNAKRSDIDKLVPDLRMVVDDLLHKAGLK